VTHVDHIGDRTHRAEAGLVHDCTEYGAGKQAENDDERGELCGIFHQDGIDAGEKILAVRA
jgi:hypothetical protein